MVKIVALLCSFGVGLCFSLLGSISVKLMPRLKIDKAKFGSLISFFMFANLVASLVMGVVVDKAGYKPVAVFGFVATGMCIFIFAQGKTFATVVLPCLLLGFGAMALCTAGNTLIPKVLFCGTNEAAALNLGNAFFGLGLFVTPLLVSLLFKKTSYEKAVSALAVIAFVPVLFALLATYPAIRAGFEIKQALLLLTEPVVLIAALSLFCYISLESSFTNWLAPYGKELISRSFAGLDGSIVDASAQQILSAFAVAMMVGRLVASQLQMITTHGSWFVAGCALVAAVVIIAMMKTGVLWASTLAVCAGLVFAPCFPTIVGVTLSKHPENFGSVFGIIFAIGLLGAVIVPKLIGNLATGSSVQKSLRLLLPACILLIILVLVLGLLKPAGVAVP